MDPQHPSQHPYSRLQIYPTPQDIRAAPLPPPPPPPYSTSSSAHNTAPPLYDPFRRREPEAQHRTQTPPFSAQGRPQNSAEYLRQSYAGSPAMLRSAAHDTHMRHSSYSSGALYGSSGEIVRGHSKGEGKQYHRSDPGSVHGIVPSSRPCQLHMTQRLIATVAAQLSTMFAKHSCHTEFDIL